MISKRTKYKRFKQLINHMKQPQEKLAHERFTFSCYNTINYNEKFKPNNCGTMGCVVGEFPAIWPDDWCWDLNGVLLKKDPYHHTTQEGVSYWLGINLNEANHLFYPFKQRTDTYGGKYLKLSATKEEVLENIIIFFEAMKARDKTIVTLNK